MRLVHIRHSIIAAAAFAADVTPQQAMAKFVPPPMPAGYDDPGPMPADAVAKILMRLKTELKDPYSVRDFATCAAYADAARPPVMKGKPWERAYRYMFFQLRAKNGFGAYTGLQDGIARFQGGELQRVSYYPTITAQSEREANSVAKRGTCRPIPDSEVKRLMGVAQ